MADVRIDKFLWSVRLFKTRSLAAEACKKGKVLMGNEPAKSSRTVKVGDIIAIKQTPATYSYKVLELAHTRMGAKLVPNYLLNITPPDQLELIETMRLAAQLNRPRGMGRPTKKDRRDIEEFFEEN